MGRRTPYIRGRGNVAPPIGYRPGRKAGWLLPRPLHPQPTPEEPELLLTSPQIVNYTDVPNNGDTLAGPTVPANAVIVCMVLNIVTPWDNIADDPRFNLYYPTRTTPKVLFFRLHLGSDLVNPGDQWTMLPSPDYLDADMIPTAIPQATTLQFAKDGTDPTTQGQATVQLGYLPYP